MADIREIAEIASTTDPARSLEVLRDDLFERLRRQGVQQRALSGIWIAMRIAYRLGERAAALAMARENT